MNNIQKASQHFIETERDKRNRATRGIQSLQFYLSVCRDESTTIRRKAYFIINKKTAIKLLSKTTSRICVGHKGTKAFLEI